MHRQNFDFDRIRKRHSSNYTTQALGVA